MRVVRVIKFILFLVLFISIFVYMVTPYVFRRYELSFSTLCREHDMFDVDSKVDLNDKYCPLCGELLENELLVYSNSYCSSCGKSIGSSKNYCQNCGGTITSCDYVPLKDVSVEFLSNIDNIRLLSNIEIGGFCVASITFLLLVVLLYFEDTIKCWYANRKSYKIISKLHES